eukprot:1150700-Pelagomonas_calceolata.AAC.1
MRVERILFKSASSAHKFFKRTGQNERAYWYAKVCAVCPHNSDGSMSLLWGQIAQTSASMKDVLSKSGLLQLRLTYCCQWAKYLRKHALAWPDGHGDQTGLTTPLVVVNA